MLFNVNVGLLFFFAEQFRKALDLMNRAVSTPGQPLSQQPGAVESVSYLTNIECNQQQVRRERERDRESRLEVTPLLYFSTLTFYVKNKNICIVCVLILLNCSSNWQMLKLHLIIVIQKRLISWDIHFRCHFIVLDTTDFIILSFLCIK